MGDCSLEGASFVPAALGTGYIFEGFPMAGLPKLEAERALLTVPMRLVHAHCSDPGRLYSTTFG